MNIFVVVTSANGAEVVEASKFVERSSTLVFHVAGNEKKEFPKRDVLIWQQCETPAEAIGFIAEHGP